MSSTDSQPGETQRQAETELTKAMSSSAGVARLGRMGAVKSVLRNLQHEDEAVRRDTDAHHRSLWGGSTDPNSDAEEDMEIMVAGDLTINEHRTEPPKSGALTKAAIAASLLAAGAVPAAVGTYLLADHDEPTPPAVERPDTDTQYGLSVSSTPPPPAEVTDQ